MSQSTVSFSLTPAPLPTRIQDLRELDCVKEDACVEASDKEFIRYNRAFIAKMSLTEDKLKVYYNIIKNTLMSYRGMHNRLSWCNDSFNIGRHPVAKINVRGGALLVYLALDPMEVDAKYRLRDVGQKTKFSAVPLLLKVRSKRGVGYVIELLAELMAKLGAVQGVIGDVAYAPITMTHEELVSRNLVRRVGKGNEEAEDSIDVEAVGIASAPAVEAACEDAPTENAIIEEPAVAEVASAEQDSFDIDAEDIPVSDLSAFKHYKRKKKGNYKAMVNLSVINRAFRPGDVVDLDALLARRLVPSTTGWYKVCASGVIEKPLTIVANQFSANTERMIQDCGGKAVKIK